MAVKVERIEYHEPDGLVGFVKDLNKSQETLHEVVYFQGESEGITVEVAFQYVKNFMRTYWGSATIFIMRKVVLILRDSRQYLPR